MSRSVALALVIVLGASLAACASREPSPAALAAAVEASPDLKALHSRCVDAMVRNACAAKEGTAQVKPEASPVVMIAGVGAVDARFYGALREAGDQMCGQIVQPCSDSWDGAACRTARALWPAAPDAQGLASLPQPIRR